MDERISDWHHAITVQRTLDGPRVPSNPLARHLADRLTHQPDTALSPQKAKHLHRVKRQRAQRGISAFCKAIGWPTTGLA